MWHESFQAVVKGMKLYAEGARRLLDLTLEMELSGELGYGIPRGLETVHALESGDYKRLVVGHEATEYDVKITAPPTEADGKPVVFQATDMRIAEIALARKVDKEGDVTVVAKPVLTFRVSDDLMLFVAHHFDSKALSWQATKRQLELNIPVDTATREEMKGRKPPKAKA